MPTATANDTLSAQLARAQRNVTISSHNITYWLSRRAAAATFLLSAEHNLGFSLAFPLSLKDLWVSEAMDALLAGDDESFELYDDLASAVEVVAAQAQKLEKAKAKVDEWAKKGSAARKMVGRLEVAEMERGMEMEMEKEVDTEVEKSEKKTPAPQSLTRKWKAHSQRNLRADWHVWIENGVHHWQKK